MACIKRLLPNNGLQNIDQPILAASPVPRSAQIKMPGITLMDNPGEELTLFYLGKRFKSRQAGLPIQTFLPGHRRIFSL
ncbi:hypothetical protein [Microbulbifer harenosus]|uniref:Uncharacterized protein n=1 Tax=Microbulbifer harenosus TaxID=2576840 RepID=A0ABY2UG33_9GAMM|nr:hypothetical protein [Microbulbifer harenosus]TLM76381.1 hypothetical protein FDY93_13430 [Microbulbifer harenosus]